MGFGGDRVNLHSCQRADLYSRYLSKIEGRPASINIMQSARPIQIRRHKDLIHSTSFISFHRAHHQFQSFTCLLNMEKIPILTLHDGGKIPQLGLGTAHNTQEGVEKGLKLGYKHLDGAYHYQNQDQVGRAIKNSGVPRDQLFITSKVWKTHMSKKRVLDSLDITLKDLGTDYVDLLLVHWPYVDGVDPKNGEVLKKMRLQVWNTFIELKRSGKVRHIGVSNFLPKHIDQLIQNTCEKPVVNQIIHHPYLVLDEIVEYCKKNDILVEAWSPLAQHRHGLLEDKTINEIAGKHKKTPAEIILRWVVQSGHITFPKSSDLENLKENMNIFDFKLQEDEMKQMNSLNKRAGNIDQFQTKDMYVE